MGSVADLHNHVEREDPKPKDSINPDHYKSGHPLGIECIEVTRHYGFSDGNAIKYLWRAGNKGDLVEDLKKAEWYVRDALRDCVVSYQVDPTDELVGISADLMFGHYKIKNPERYRALEALWYSRGALNRQASLRQALRCIQKEIQLVSMNEAST